MAEYRVDHLTRYDYSESVSRCYNIAAIRPAHRHGQVCISSELDILPRPSSLSMRTDYFGNERYHFSVFEEHRSLSIRSLSLVRTAVPPEEGQDVGSGAYSNLMDDAELCEYLLPSPLLKPHPVLGRLMRPFFRNVGVLDGCRALCRFINENFSYTPGSTTIHTPIEEVLRTRRGVCQDFTHLAIAGLREMGIPARYVSGYIETLPPSGQEKLIGADATHAWFSVFLPGRGWFDFDPTNGQARTDEYVEVSIGRDFSDISPMRGVLFGGGKPALRVAVDVTRI